MKDSTRERPATREDFVGAWRLEKFTSTDTSGNTCDMMGPTPFGQISYGSDGHMSAHLVHSDPAGQPPMLPYIAYFGNFTLEADRGVVTHHVEGATERSMVGTDQERHYEFGDGTLTLSATIGERTHNLVWRKLAGGV